MTVRMVDRFTSTYAITCIVPSPLNRCVRFTPLVSNTLCDKSLSQVGGFRRVLRVSLP
jgi:hypothetical protein